MNELEKIILKEKLKPKPNYDYIRWLQQLSLENYKMFKTLEDKSLFIQK